MRAVIAGNRVIVIAGMNALGGISFSRDGSDSHLLPQISAPERLGFSRHSVVSDGRTAYLWGGCCRGSEISRSLAGGAAYDAVTGRWRRLPTAPFGSEGHVAVWTGEEMIIWGGVAASECIVRPGGDDTCDFRERETSRGVAYDPRTDDWRPIAASPLAPRTGASAVWTGDEMIVWGGWQTHHRESLDGPPLVTRGVAFESYADGAAYNPRTDSWRPVARAPVPSARYDPAVPTVRHGSAVWTGKRMIVWNGEQAAVYSPRADRWRDAAPAPLRPRTDPSVVWTGKRMLVWGGLGGARAFADGAAYEPRKDRWELLPAPPGNTPRRSHATAWTGLGMLVWGGHPGGGTAKPLQGGAIYVSP